MNGSSDAALGAATRSIATGDFEEAEDIASTAIRAGRDDPALRLAHATALAKQLSFDRAIEQCLHVLHRAECGEPHRLGAIRVMACCATQIGDPDMVRPHLRAIPFERSTRPTERSWRPRILARIGAADEARRDLVALLDAYPGDPLIVGLLGQTLQEMGEAEGLHLEMALMGRAFFSAYNPTVHPLNKIWEGEPLAGRSIVLVPQGGFGDLFDCIRFAGRLKDLGAARVTAIIGEKARGLVAGAGVDEVVDFPEAEAAIGRSDVWVPIPGLKRVAVLSREVAWRGGYLKAPESDVAPALVRAMRERAAGRPCVGLYWHSDRDLGEHKSVPLSALWPLFARQDVHWVILQRGFGLRRLRASGLGAEATVLGDDLSFDDTAAVMAGLDGVVSICAWAFHLAGALGLRTWLLAGRVMDCRHLDREHDAVLYADCASLVRQPRIGDWPGAIARLTAELDVLALAHRADAVGTAAQEIPRQ